MPDIDPVAAAIVAKHLDPYDAHMTRLLAGSAGGATGSMPEPAPVPAAAPAGPLEPHPAVVASLIDADRGGILRFEGTGPLFGVPPHDALPELVKAWREQTADQGVYLRVLPERVAAIGRMLGAEDKTVATVKLIDEVERFADQAETASKAKIVKMRDAAANLGKQLIGPGGDFPPEDARRLAEYYHCLPEDQRAVFLRRARQAGEHGVLRAVALDPLTRYVAPDLDRDKLVETAGRLRSPRTAAMADAYAALAERAESNLKTLAKLTADAVAAASGQVDAKTLAVARRVRSSH